jgi:hypothetical protein
VTGNVPACAKFEPLKLTVFDKITASPEVLAERLVFELPDGFFAAIMIYDGARFTHRETAISATVAKLTEVEM